MTGTKKEALETAKMAESARADKDGKKSKGKYLENLAQVPYICYLINFRKKSVLALFDSGSKVNAMYPVFAKKLGLPLRLTDVGVQKIDGTTLDTHRIVVADFLVKDKANQIRFFEETFLVSNVSPEVVFGMLFLILSSPDVDFLGYKLR